MVEYVCPDVASRGGGGELTRGGVHPRIIATYLSGFVGDPRTISKGSGHDDPPYPSSIHIRSAPNFPLPVLARLVHQARQSVRTQWQAVHQTLKCTGVDGPAV
jgi:hypothetical protein